MTKGVFITIKGLQKYFGEEEVETVTEAEAEYFLRNQSHYIMFEEKQEGFSESTKSILKIKNNCVELTKKGLVQSHMVFERDNVYMADYRTPFGGFMLGIRTKGLRILETDARIAIDIEYVLESNEQPMADCRINITIKEKK